jgi:hypothetical protein
MVMVLTPLSTILSQVADKLYHIMVYTLPWSRFEFTTTVVIGTDCIGSCKSNHHAITATTYPTLILHPAILKQNTKYTQSYSVILANTIILNIVHNIFNLIDAEFETI